MRGRIQNWTNDSVLKFAGGREPVQAIVQAAREMVLGAIDRGWEGPPFDPIKLAELKGFLVSPRSDIPDARTVAQGNNRFLIEYNPTRPAGRLRYSIAHEIAHTLFPDCAERVRNRSHAVAGQGNGWQLEALCNIAAAEILMPVGSMQTDRVDHFDIDKISEIRKEFDVSTEAILIRLAHLSEEACAIFVASKHDNTTSDTPYTFDYLIPSRNWKYVIARGTKLPEDSPVPECTAVSFTAKGEIKFPHIPEALRLECIGIPAYPGAMFPRVAGFLSSQKPIDTTAEFRFLQGNVLEPRGNGRKLVAHIVSDATPNWGGGGIAMALKKKWPAAQSVFRDWFTDRHRRKLGDVHFCQVDSDIEVASMICQHGYGPSATPRLRYAALEAALKLMADWASGRNATIHIPRIGCGQAGGSWMLVQELISATLLAAGLSVTVYDLPQANASPSPSQLSLTAVS